MGPGGFFVPTNPDLADILGDTDFDFEICSLDFLILFSPLFFRSQISRLPGSQISRFPDRGLGQAWAGLGPAGAPSAAPPDHKVGEIQGTRIIP